ncbi:MAG: glycerate 2-kinase [Sulfolobaceae archaeon]|nr:glycerate 2-kinase [Sulfolobaceae archaeon]
MNDNWIVQKILEYSDPYAVLSRELKITPNEIHYNGFVFSFKKPLLIAVGKASYKMAKFFIERLKPIRSIVIVPKSQQVRLENAEIIYASHPYPDENSLIAGNIAIEALQKEDYDLVIFLLSGGASALFESTEMSLEELRELNKVLVNSGISINEINVVRKHVSNIKGGNLTKYARSKIVSFIVSDVPGDDISSIGSGPTAPDPYTLDQAVDILKKLGIEEKYRKYLHETQKRVENAYNFIILNNFYVLKSISSDLQPSIILTDQIRGEARDVGMFFASVANTSVKYGTPIKNGAILVGGEPEVTIGKNEKAGKGGRNGEVCLSFLRWINKTTSVKLYAIATDGIDGNSEYAGCIVDSSLGISDKEISEGLKNHSSYEILEKYNAIIKTGPTYTNVNNIYIILLNAP